MRTLLWSLIACSAAFAQNHNVLLIVADDIGVDYVGAYLEGTNPPPTPTIDALAQNGVLFRNAWANPSCSPTRACVMTGRYPFRTLVGRWISHSANPPNVGLLQPEERTLAEVLDAAQSGYTHSLIGKWHLNNAFASPDSPRAVGGYSYHAGSLEGQIPSYTNWTRVVNGVAAATTTYCTTQNTDDALAWIQSQTSPWLCVLTYQAPHIPYHAPPANLHTQNLNGLTPQATTHTPANIPFYRAMVESLDTEMGRLFSTLGTAVMDDTNVVFIGDNGSVQRQSAPPFDGQRAKGTPYEGGVNVPLIISGPAVQQPGREVTALACAVDVFSTVIDLADASSGLPPFAVHDSVSLEPYLSHATQAPLRQFAYTEQFTGTSWPAPNTNGHATIRDAQYKLIKRYSGGSDELFDLINDPWETNNLNNSSNPAIQQARTVLLDEINRLRGTGGGSSFQVFGDGACVGTNGIPAISATGNPSIGSNYTITVQGGKPLSLTLFVFGYSYTNSGLLTLPLSLAVIGAHQDCILSSSADLMLLAITGFTGAVTQLVHVPSNVALVGQQLFTAGVIIDRTAPNNPGGYVSTNSLATTIGL
ncbi:MAG: arylsulfatase A-like enzyme [Neolewinella sp.]|jgi:arylsulfatase A-like enzyme